MAAHDAEQWWFKPTLRGLEYRYGTYPGAGWLPAPSYLGAPHAAKAPYERERRAT